MLKVKVDPRTGLCYLPKSIRREGFVGQIELLDNPLTVTLIKPGSKLADIRKSLRLVLEGLTFRIQQEATDARREMPEGGLLRASSEGETPTGRTQPIFLKFSRNWLHQVTGYSKGYLCRLAKGRAPISKSFIERACFSLGEAESDLFYPMTFEDQKSI